ncbi:MAG: Rpn family recombination-promoting nuclease/putative transposase, partial [Fibromonadaceae bacterium]|nr:Rpn family recombination-promoting nuclease/putative transposase [Fibromonadaceae bacterium]
MYIDKGLGCFADLKLDMPFKKTFANENEKEPLIVMLNVFLARKLKHPIVDVHIKNPYAPGQTFESRDAVFDILCHDAKGNKFLVEVQVGRKAFFIKRVLFYACMAIANNAEKGDWDFNYPPVYTLSFMDFDLDFKNDDVIQYISLSNEDHPEIRYDYINMVFVRLPLFSKRLEECQTLQDKLIFSLRHAHELKVKPKEFGEGVFDKIFDIAQIARFSKEERAKYEANMMNQRDQYAA